MKKTTTATRNIKLRFWKQALSVFLMGAMLIIALGHISGTYAQAQSFTFMGDYDRAFAAPLGYYVEQQDPYPGSNDEEQTYFQTSELLPDGSIIAGGRFVETALRGDFYLKKFTPTGALDTTFGTGGYVRTNFNNSYLGVPGTDIPQVLKVQPDGKILFAGYCTMLVPSSTSGPFGPDACVMRYNANGTLDTTFGGGTLVYTYTGPATYTVQLDPGKVIFQTGLIANGLSFGTEGTYYDMAIQPDGKIVLVGETLNYASFFGPQGYGAIIVRLNPNGSLDTTFGSGGIARWTAPESPANCFPPRVFHGVRLQSDGRIIAVGWDSVSVCNGSSSRGSRFAVTRWTAAGQLETVRHLDNDTAFIGQEEGASNVHFTRDGSKILVSGAYKNLGGSSPPQLLTMVRFNLSDLSVDTTFGSGGIRQHSGGCGSVVCGFGSGGRLQIKAIQPDGKILAVDGGGGNRNIVRYNPDGSSDQSFGNWSFDGVLPRGGLRVLVTNYNGVVNPLESGQILVRPNGRINLIGYSAAHAGLGILRAAISQQNTVLKNGIYSDFENDGRANFSVFRNGAWYWLNSTNSQFNGVQFGTAGDKLAPADYDGDGKTDIVVFRNGAWYILRSSDGQFYGVAFGAAGDLPRPGDFDGDGKADIAVFRPSTGTWYIINSSNNQFIAVQFGANGDAPLLADFDGDGRSDISVYRNGIWYWLRSSDGGFEFAQLGTTGDIPVVGDYNGDSKSDPAVFRPSNGTWYTSLNPATNYGAAQFGQNGDVPVPGDYDNDGKHDLAVYRGGSWYVLRSGDSQVVGVAFGLNTDTPIPAAYLP